MPRALALQDTVAWYCPVAKRTITGTIHFIDHANRELSVQIHPRHSVRARKRHGNWYAYRPQQGYLNLLRRTTAPG